MTRSLDGQASDRVQLGFKCRVAGGRLEFVMGTGLRLRHEAGVAGCMMKQEEILEFWIGAGPRRWFRRDPDFDEEISRRFANLHLEAARGEHREWHADARSTLALLLLLDQFPRNMYRGTAHAFATDPLAHAAAEEALSDGVD